MSSHSGRRHVREAAFFGATVVVVIAIATVTAIARGAGTNICSGASDAPSCLSVTALPSQVDVGANVLVVAKFTNQGQSTATHTSIEISAAPAGFTPTSLAAELNGTTLAGACTLATLRCDLGSVPGLAKAKVYLQATATSGAAATSTWAATVRFAEGNGNTGSANDTYTRTSNAVSLYADGTRRGTCATSAGTQSLATALGNQTAAILDVAGGAAGLPCTPLAVGVRAKQATETATTLCGGRTCRGDISFAFIPELAGGATAAVRIEIPTTALPNGPWKDVQLYELPGDDPSVAVAAIALASCPTFAGGASSCVAAISQVTRGGTKVVRWDLNVRGSTVDPRYTG
jgi:hypothetical protein